MAETLARMALGGAAFGFVMGVAGSLCLRLNYHRHSYFTVAMLTVVMPYLTFWVAENPLELSGVLATVVMSITMNKWGKLYVRHKHELHEFWELLAFIANTIVFMIAGALVGYSFWEHDFHDAHYQLVNYLFMNLIRFVFLFASVPLLNRLGYGFSWPEASIATWGGLRGAVGLSMAIMVKHAPGVPEEHREEIFDYTASLVLLTLCVNGTSAGALLRYLGYDKKSDVSVTLAKSARKKTDREC
jgi:NhaP-type Na+/H+ or K+/H+ antiporter